MFILNKNTNKITSMRSLFLVTISLLFLSANCNPNGSVPNVYEITAQFLRRTNPTDQTQTSNLQFSSPPGMSVRTDKVTMQISDIHVNATRTSGNRIPPFTAFVSQTFFRKNTDLLQGFSGVAGNLEWLRNRTGEIAICTESLWLEHGTESFGYQPADSTINMTQVHNLSSPLQPVYREAGASYLTTFTQQTMHIPWAHPDVPEGITPNLESISNPAMHLDMRLVTRILFDALSGALTATLDAMPRMPNNDAIAVYSLEPVDGVSIPVARVLLGGHGRTGSFKLHYIPQMQYNEQGNSTANNQRISVAGMGFYFEGTIELQDFRSGTPIGNLRVIIPAFLEFNATDRSGDLQVDMQPIADLARGLNSDALGLDKIVVLANTPFGIEATRLAQSVKEGIVNSLVQMANNGNATGAFVGSTIAFSSGFNKYRKKPATQLEFDVVLIPDNCQQHDNPLCFTYNGLVSTQVQPVTRNSTRISCFVLGR
jgi:hypothetical protein